MSFKKIKESEYDIQVLISEYMLLQYPKVIIHMDLAGVRLPIGLAVKIKKLNSACAWPDIFIAEPRGKYHGLFIELKRSRDDLYTKSGEYRKTRHIEEQRIMLAALLRKGYAACFACGFYGAKQIIDNYLKKSKLKSAPLTFHVKEKA